MHAGLVPGVAGNGGPTIDIILAFDPAAAGRVVSTVRSLSPADQRQLAAGDLGDRGRRARRVAELATLVANDSRIRSVDANAEGYAAALRAAAEQCESDFLMVLRPGDRLHPGTISVLAQTLVGDPRIDILHADEDVGEETTSHSPQLKPEWSPELLTSYNYFGRPTVIRRERLIEAGSFDESLGEACEWDLNLRLTEPFAGVVATAHVRRLPLILCHRDPLSGNGRPAPDDPQSQSYRAALQKHWLRQGFNSEVATQPDGTLHAVWPIAEPPLVSIIIPSKNKAGLLRVCLEGLLERTDYPRIEIIVVDNGSAETETLQLFEEMSARGVRLVDFDQPFNYSRACNLGAAAATGTLLLFLNNDIEVLSPGWLEELVRYALRPGVGVVGTKLVYPDGVLQHAGVVVGVHLCGLVFNRARRKRLGAVRLAQRGAKLARRHGRLPDGAPRGLRPRRRLRRALPDRPERHQAHPGAVAGRLPHRLHALCRRASPRGRNPRPLQSGRGSAPQRQGHQGAGLRRRSLFPPGARYGQFRPGTAWRQPAFASREPPGHRARPGRATVRTGHSRPV